MNTGTIIYDPHLPNSQFVLKGVWTQTPNGVGNYSDIELKVYFVINNQSVGAKSNCVGNINGVSDTYTTEAFQDADTTWHDHLIFTHTERVNHNSDGTKTLSIISCQVPFNGVVSNQFVGLMTASESDIVLDAIDRSGPTVSVSATPVSTSSMTITGTATKACNDWRYSLDGGSTWTQFSTTSGTSASITLTGLTSQVYSGVRVRAYRTDNAVYGTSGSASVDLVAPVITIALSDGSTTSVRITATSDVACDLWHYSLDGGSTWTQYSTTSDTSAAVTVTGLTINTTYSIRVKGRKTSNQLVGTSAPTSYATLSGTTLNGVNTLYADDASPVLTLNWTVQSASFTHTLAIKNGSTTILTLTGLSGTEGTHNKTVTLTSAQRATLLTAMANLSSFYATYVLTTYDGGTQAGAASEFTGLISTQYNTSAPTFTAFSHADTNAVTIAVTGSASTYVQGQSTLQVSCTAATAKNGASIVKYVAKIGDKSVESSTTAISFGTIPYGTPYLLEVSAVDSRGYATTVSQTITIYPYVPITLLDYDVKRQNGIGTTIQIAFNGEFSPVTIGGTAQNSFQSASYRLRETGGSWGSFTSIANVTTSGVYFAYTNNSWMTLTDTKSYDVELTIADRITSTVVGIYINQGKPLVAFRSEKVGINTNYPTVALDVDGSGKYTGTLEVDGPVNLKGDGVMSYKGALASGTDLNDVSVAGWYETTGNETNVPAGNAGYLEVLSGGTFIVQRYNTGSRKVYQRTYTGSTWTTWQTII